MRRNITKIIIAFALIILTLSIGGLYIIAIQPKRDNSSYSEIRYFNAQSKTISQKQPNTVLVTDIPPQVSAKYKELKKNGEAHVEQCFAPNSSVRFHVYGKSNENGYDFSPDGSPLPSVDIKAYRCIDLATGAIRSIDNANGQVHLYLDTVSKVVHPEGGSYYSARMLLSSKPKAGKLAVWNGTRCILTDSQSAMKYDIGSMEATHSHPSFTSSVCAQVVNFGSSTTAYSLPLVIDPQAYENSDDLERMIYTVAPHKIPECENDLCKINFTEKDAETAAKLKGIGRSEQGIRLGPASVTGKGLSWYVSQSINGRLIDDTGNPISCTSHVPPCSGCFATSDASIELNATTGKLYASQGCGYGIE